MRRTICALIVMALCMPMAIMPAGAGDDAKYPMIVTDSAGRVVTIPMPVQRIIALNTDHAEAVALLGAADKIVGAAEGATKKTDYLPGLVKTPIVGGQGNEEDLEMYAEIARNDKNTIVPDIIILAFTFPGKPYGAGSIAERLEAFNNITVIGLDFYKPENLTREIELLGKILDKNQEAEEYLEWFNSSKKNIVEAIEDKTRPRVYFEMNSNGGLGELASYGLGSGMNGVIKESGGENIAENLGAYPKVTWEWVIEENPDIILKEQNSDKLGFDVTLQDDMTTVQNLRDEILSRPGAENINAIKNQQVYIVFRPMLMGTDHVVGQTFLANIFYPVADLHPENAYKEYLNLFGLEPPQNRVYVYPSR
jgi:iron complex transport system substrate-binding protein